MTFILSEIPQFETYGPWRPPRPLQIPLAEPGANLPLVGP